MEEDKLRKKVLDFLQGIAEDPVSVELSQRNKDNCFKTERLLSGTTAEVRPFFIVPLCAYSFTVSFPKYCSSPSKEQYKLDLETHVNSILSNIGFPGGKEESEFGLGYVNYRKTEAFQKLLGCFSGHTPDKRIFDGIDDLKSLLKKDGLNPLAERIYMEDPEFKECIFYQGSVLTSNNYWRGLLRIRRPHTHFGDYISLGKKVEVKQV